VSARKSAAGVLLVVASAAGPLIPGKPAVIHPAVQSRPEETRDRKGPALH